MTLKSLLLTLKGSSKSGNFGHGGRPGKRGGSSPKISSSDFYVGGNTTSKVIDETTNRVSSRWNVDEFDLKELAKEEGISIENLSNDQAKHRLTYHYLRTWAGSSGDPGSTYAISSVADSLGLKYNLNDRNKDIREYIKNKPALDRALSSFGKAIYDDTQDWLKEKGVSSLKLYRAGDSGKDKPFTSWALNYGGVRSEGGRKVITERIPSKFIFSIPNTGFGTAFESEVVVLPRL